MTHEDFLQLLTVLTKLADRQYTISGASDWPILLVVGGILLTAIAMMWSDLKTSMKESKQDWQDDLRSHKEDDSKAHDAVWSAMRDCKDDCCPALLKHRENARHE